MAHGNAHPSNPSPSLAEVRWHESAAYRDMMDALAAAGYPSHKAIVAPGVPREVRDRFHADWTRRMQARCGIDPLVQTKVERTSRHRIALMRKLRDEGVALVAIGARFGMTGGRVHQLLTQEAA